MWRARVRTQGRSPTDPLETVPISTLKVPQTRMVYTRSRQDMTWRSIDLKRIDFSAQSTKTAMVASVSFAAVDVTAELL